MIPQGLHEIQQHQRKKRKNLIVNNKNINNQTNTSRISYIE